MRPLQSLTLLLTAFPLFGKEPAIPKAYSIGLSAHQLSIATGQPSLVVMGTGSMQVPVWSLSGGTPGQSVAGVIPALPHDCTAVKVEITVTSNEPAPESGLEDVYRVHLGQLVDGKPLGDRYLLGSPVRTPLAPEPFMARRILLESHYSVVPGAPLWVRVQREPADPADTFARPGGLVSATVTPVPRSLATPVVVQDVKGYNSWPMIQTLGDKLVCVYTRGSGHTIAEDARAAYARTSLDQGKTWTPETLVASTPGYGDVPVGKGLDANGALLVWIRRVGKDWQHDLYRSTDGVSFTLVATPKLDTRPVQITDIFSVPQVGLMALWFGGSYSDAADHSWGTVTSSDNGATWKQTVVESGLTKNEWPTEPAAVFLGDGRILGIARTEMGGPTTDRCQFQLQSSDSGATWTRQRTNITDVTASTPSLILDQQTGLLSNYYYQRGRGGLLRRRVAQAAKVWDQPLRWPASEAVAQGSEVTFDAGNVNATMLGSVHHLAFYSGEAPQTSVLSVALPAPKDLAEPAAR